MKHKWKKAAAFTLALALVAGAAPANVGGFLTGGTAIVASAATTVTTFDQLQNASGSVVIGADIEYSEFDFWFYDNNVDIDLNGHTITLAQAYFGTYGDLTIRDSKGDGKILMLGDGVRVPGGNLILEGGTLESNSEHGPIDVYGGTFTMNGGTITGPKSIWREEGSVIINGGNVNGEFDETETSLSITGGIFNFDVTSLVNAGVSVTKIDNLWYVGDSAPSIVDLSTATVTLADDYTVASVVLDGNTLTADTDYTVSYMHDDITLGAAPTDPGTYTAVITGTGNYTGTVSKEFTIEAAEEPAADTTTVTWDSSNLSSLYVNNSSQTIDGITIKSNATFVTSYWYDELSSLEFEADASGGYTFTNTLGKNFTKIEIMATWDWDSSIVNALGSGWSYANRKATWTGNAASVDLFTESSYLYASAFSIVFTLDSAEAEISPVAITGAATVSGESSLLRFAYNCYAEDAEAYGVLIKRDAAEEPLTEETASADKQLDEAADFFRSDDSGKGITLRPYYVLNGERIYGEQVYYTFDEVNAKEGAAAITGAAVYNAAKGKIDFTYEAHYEGEGTVTYGVLIKRGLAEGVKLTRKLAAADYPLSSAEATFRSQDKGEGITLRPYIEIDGVRKYGAQVTYYLSDLVG